MRDPFWNHPTTFVESEITAMQTPPRRRARLLSELSNIVLLDLALSRVGAARQEWELALV